MANGVLQFDPRLPRWAPGTVPAGASRRQPPARCDGAREVRGFIKSNVALKLSLASGMFPADAPQTSENGAASLPWATPEIDIASSSGAETGTPFSIQIYGSAGWCQLVVRNATGGAANVSAVDSELL